ncbi:ABC transporter ATP-binding protein [Dactylosporangium sp. CA-052675]|uniref:ABC transporter ATP-binding protein n=1 Tax=Dactylosporangium sp. CA-052675 TaxID=3239927 RepID=UPI003D8D00FC
MSVAALDVRDVRIRFGGVTALDGISLTVAPGEICGLIGPNGAGKTTLFNCITRIYRPDSGTVRFGARDLLAVPRHRIVRHGIARTFQNLALFVHENLRVGAAVRGKDRDGIAADIEYWYEVFPVLRARAKQIAGTLSGGEQQMLAVARALMSRPKLLLCDEISLGLAPKIVAELFAVLRRINDEDGTALLLVEQNAELALDLAGRAYLLEVGRVAGQGPAAEFRDNDAVRRAYLEKAAASPSKLSHAGIMEAARTQEYRPPMFIDGIKWRMAPSAPLGILAFRPFQWDATGVAFKPFGDVIDISGKYITK